MPQLGYGFSYTDYADFRLIRTVTPPVVTEDRLSIAVWRFFAMFDTELPCAVISDYTAVTVFADEAILVLKAVFVKSFADERLLGASWFVGDNAFVGNILRTLLISVGKDPGLVVATDLEAVAILRAAGINIPDGA